MIDLDAVSQTNLTTFNRTIAQWTRLSGGVDERAAAAYAEGQLIGFGYAAQTILHDAYISLPGPATLRLTRPDSPQVACITHSMGVPTPPGGVSSELVYAGKGTLGDYARVAAAEKVALVDGRATPQHAVDATRAGVRGLICISGRSPHEMCCSRCGGTRRTAPPASFPACISSP